MRDWGAERIAHAAGVGLVVPARERGGPRRAVIDSREAGPGDLFVGLRGRRADGGAFAAQALAAGAWGVLVGREHAARASREGWPGAVLAGDDPLAALQRLARAWRRRLRAKVIGVTGSTGKTTTKDLLHAVLAPHRRTVASRANFNTEIGVPLEILSAAGGTEAIVLEMAMRGPGQIAELAAIAEPDVGVIVNVGPVHLELLGTVEAVAAAKAELLAALAPGSTAVVPAGEPLLEAHLRALPAGVRTVTFGDGGDVRLLRCEPGRVAIDVRGRHVELEVSFEQAHLRHNLLAAVAAADAIGVVAGGAVRLELPGGRGRRIPLAVGATLIDDCYNANPMSVRAALRELAAEAARGGHRRRVAVLGDMLELGPSARELHAQVAEQARAAGVDSLVAVGPLAAVIAERFGGECHRAGDASEAAALVASLIRPGDVVLVKGSRGVGLERVCEALRALPAGEA